LNIIVRFAAKRGIRWLLSCLWLVANKRVDPARARRTESDRVETDAGRGTCSDRFQDHGHFRSARLAICGRC
jgi:hypothetical protein